MCICINCKYINICETYQNIEKQHKNSKLIKRGQFIPQNTIINANLNNKKYYNEIEWDVIECLSFVEQPGHWLNFEIKV